VYTTFECGCSITQLGYCCRKVFARVTQTRFMAVNALSVVKGGKVNLAHVIQQPKYAILAAYYGSGDYETRMQGKLDKREAEESSADRKQPCFKMESYTPFSYWALPCYHIQPPSCSTSPWLKGVATSDILELDIWSWLKLCLATRRSRSSKYKDQLGKENGVNILKSIDEGPFQMGTFRETLTEGTEGAPNLGNEHPTSRDAKRYLLPYESLHRCKGHMRQCEDAPKRVDIIEVKQGRLSATTAMELALNVDNVFQADDCDAFDSDVDEAPTSQTMFMANLSSADPVYDEVGPSYDLDILSEVHDHDHYQDTICEHHEEHEMHDDVQLNYVVDSHANYMSDSNMIPYEQYVKDNALSVIPSNVSFVLNDAYMMIFNDMHEPHAQPISVTTRNTIVDNSLTAELATYKEQVELYERRAMFELTEREQKIDEQLRIVIIDRNIKEETLKKELHSVKMQLASTINHNNSEKGTSF
ncbi:hypothetical protein Tco_0896758, partial [Tanacetum coccineum]